MSLTEEYTMQRLLSECASLFGRQEKEAETALLQRLDEINAFLHKNISETFANFSAELIVKFAEVAVEVPSRRHYSQTIIKLYFQRFKDPTQFYIRALLVRAQLVAYQGHDKEKKGEELVDVLKEAISYISKALDIIAGPADVAPVKGKDSKGDPNAGGGNKQRYGFLIYNASTCLYKIIRFMLRQNWQRNFADIVERVYKLLEEVDEPDHNWRCRFTWTLYLCLYDADKKQDAFKILDLLWDKTKTKNCDFQEALFRTRVHVSKENNALAAVIKKDLEGPSDERGWRVLEVLQRIRSGIIPEPQVEKELMGVINQISSAVLTGNDTSANNLTAVMQERLAEAGRIALQFNLINIANSVCNFLSKVRQPTQKAMVLNEYNKAELLIKKPGPSNDSKTGMKLNNVQIRLQEIELRSQSLKLLEKVMIINKRLNDADLIYEGAVLIWNTCLPFMTPTYRELFTKSFEAASMLLEQIDSTDHALRVKLHLELAKVYFSNESLFSRVDEHLNKALALDYSVPLSKLIVKPETEEDPGLYQRPYDRYLQALKEKAQLKKNSQERSATELERIMMELWNVMGQKSENTRIDILQRCLGSIVNTQEKDYDIDEARQRSLVDEQIRAEMVQHKQANLRELKKKKLLAAEIAELAFEWEINEVAEKACEFVVVDKWDPKNAVEMVVTQSKCYYFLAQIHIDQLLRDNFEVAFADAIPIEEEEEDSKPEELSPTAKDSILARKRKIFSEFSRGMELAEQTQQSWLIFNGAIYIWNNFLHIFKNLKNDPLLLPELNQILKGFFEAMRNSLKESEKKQVVSYDTDAKIQVLANIGMVYARQMENLKQADEVNRICDALLATQLSPHTRKLVNSIKSRVASGKAAPPAPKAADKGAKVPPGGQPAATSATGDLFLFDIFSQLEIIKNSVGKSENEALIKKCFETLENWKAKENDETELELHAELWARLASLALNEANTTMYKYALRCVEYSLSMISSKVDAQTIPPNRLRWYSLAEYLYSDALAKIVNPETQEPENCERLLFAALDHAVEAANKGLKCGIQVLVTDASKQVWNISSRLQESATNRQKLIKPIFTTLSSLKTVKEKNETDLLMLLSQLLFKASLQNGEYTLGESAADMLFELLPKGLHRPLWQAKMIFMSKQGKNELQAISNMKEADASLQAKLWVKLARVSAQQEKQNTAYNKAIEILKKENSVEIVEVLIEFAEFKLRTGKERVGTAIGNLLLAADYLIDIEYGDDHQDEIEEDRATVFSRSTRGKRSQHSSSQKSKQSKSQKPSEKKSVASASKSKGSRMNRTARVTKTVKSKNTKSIFAQREQEGSPESLNCAHYQRLFRIHAILAWIAQSSEERIRYALDAKEFMIKILEMSFRTLNTMQENAAKYTNVIDDKKQARPEEFVKKYNMPSSHEDWIKLQLPKEFLEKVKTYEDYNFMGVFLFDKAELTFTYLNQLIDLLDRMGFQLQTIPLHFFVRFMAKEVLNNPTLMLLCDLRLCSTLRRCNFAKELYEGLLDVATLAKFKLTEQQRKLALNKTQSLRARPLESNDEFGGSEPPQPNLVKPFSERIYHLWIGIAEEYIRIGQIPKATDLLRESLKHCKILSDVEAMGKCYLQLTKIAYLEGELAEAATNCMTVNKLCRDVRQWLDVYPVIFKILAKIEKYDDLESMSMATKDALSQIIKDSEREKKPEGPSHQQELLDIKNLLVCVQMHALKLAYLRLADDPSVERLQRLMDSLAALEASPELSAGTQLLHSSLYSFFAKLANQLLECAEETDFEQKTGHNCDKLLSSTINKLLKVLSRLEEQIMSNLKYTSIGLEQRIFFTNNPLMAVHYEVRLALARAHVLVGVFRRIMRFGSFAQEDEAEDEVHPLNTDFEPLKKYLEHLNLQIQKALTLIPKRLDSSETAVSILSNLEMRIPKNSYLYLILGVEMCSARRKLAASKEQLAQVWSGTEPSEEQTCAVASLQHCVSFLQEYEDRMDDLLAHPGSLSYCKRLYVELLENTGVLVPEKSFEALVKHQHYSYSERIFKRVFSVVDSNNKLVTYLRLFRQFSQPVLQISTQLTSNPVFQALTKFPSFSEAVKMLPSNHLLAVLQLSPDCNSLYFGWYANVKGATPEANYFIKNHELSPKEKSAYFKLKRELLQIKTSLARVPIDEADPKKYASFIAEAETKLTQLMKMFEELSEWWATPLAEFLNAKKSEPASVVDPKDVKKTGKDAGKASKKGGKDEVGAYESPLGAAPCGIDNLTFLLDSELSALPFEHLSCVSVVPSVGRDSSLFYLSRKLQQIGYRPELNNSNGFGADRSKFVCYDYKAQEYGGQNLLNAVTKEAPAFKFEGVSSKKRVPSVGEFQKLLNTGGIMHFYGSCCLVNTLRCGTLLNSLDINKIRLMVVLDNVNARKSSLEKYDPVEKGQTLTLEEEEQALIDILNLMNVSLVKNRWSPPIDSVMDTTRRFYKALGEEIYVGGALKKTTQTESATLLEKLMLVYNGPPMLRI